jgi:hypothetical protein
MINFGIGESVPYAYPPYYYRQPRFVEIILSQQVAEWFRRVIMFANKQEKCPSSQEGKEGTVEDSRCEKQTASVEPLGANSSFVGSVGQSYGVS